MILHTKTSNEIEIYVVGGKAGDETWGGGGAVNDNLYFRLHPLLFWHVKALFERIMKIGFFLSWFIKLCTPSMLVTIVK